MGMSTTCNGCGRQATTVITFTDAAKRRYCSKCAARIGGAQRPIEQA